MKKKIIPFIIGALMLTGCDDLFSPAIENFQGVENMYNDAEYTRELCADVLGLIAGYYRRFVHARRAETWKKL